MTCEPIFRFIRFSSEGGTRLREEHGEVRQRAGNQGTGRSGLCVQVTGTVAAPRCLRSSSNGVEDSPGIRAVVVREKCGIWRGQDSPG